jgi:hypothetical protein
MANSPESCGSSITPSEVPRGSWNATGFDWAGKTEAEFCPPNEQG